MRVLPLALVVILFAETPCFPQTVDESVKRFIYEITSPGVGRGTGFVVKDSVLGYALVTCRHGVQDKTGDYVDSIIVRMNKLLTTGQAVSDTSRLILHLKVDGSLYVAEHPNPDIDLVMIPFLPSNAMASPNQQIVGLLTQTISSKDMIDRLGINEGTEVELIGFSLSSSLRRESSHYHFSRFGKIGLYTTDEFTLIIDGKPRSANFILLDMTVRPGDSGSPIFSHIGGKTYLIGFIAAQADTMEYGIGYPVYYLYDLLEILRERYRDLLGRDKGETE